MGRFCPFRDVGWNPEAFLQEATKAGCAAGRTLHRPWEGGKLTSQSCNTKPVSLNSLLQAEGSWFWGLGCWHFHWQELGFRSLKFPRMIWLIDITFQEANWELLRSYAYFFRVSAAFTHTHTYPHIHKPFCKENIVFIYFNKSLWSLCHAF